ncbi:MAG: chorismate lyase [Gammaproteobacteria bacterium]|nr:chorismate lyase [Gammaproteobacteria bacterium]
MLLSTFQPMPLALLAWLRCQHAITDKLSKVAQDVRVEVLSHQWQPTNYWERQVLGLKDNTLIRRDVVISAANQACWFARTMIPEQAYQHDPAFFDRLEHVSLATLVYDEPRVVRERMHSYSFSPAVLEYHWLPHAWSEGQTPLWGRLSTFCFDGHFYFYLFEIFLPRFIRALESSLPINAVG